MTTSVLISRTKKRKTERQTDLKAQDLLTCISVLDLKAVAIWKHKLLVEGKHCEGRERERETYLLPILAAVPDNGRERERERG
mgnify:CR=1 FL=1